MRFAFPSHLAPDPVQATELGYDGLELACITDPASLAAGNSVPAQVSPNTIEIACLSTTLSMPIRPRDRRPDSTVSVALRQVIDAAHALGCRLIRILDPIVPRGTTPAIAAVAMAQWLLPLADHAGQRGVTIVVANAQSFRTARPLWTLLETINHPNVAASWDLLDAQRAGQSPHVAVPTLNTRIQYPRLADAAIRPDGQLESRPLGEGDLPIRDFLDRLRGVGYTGYITYAPPTADDLAPALEKLREWTKPQLIDKGKKTPAPLHP